jgi:CPA2 family monovalent cation:H+ antiporter-2
MPELETIFGLTIALGAAAATEHIGLGGALGAFAAGLALGGGEHRHAVESNLRPLLGVTAVLFFASMGALFDARFVLANWWQIAALVLASGVLKAGIAAFGLRLAGLPPRSALGTGLLLAQIGEFSFVLATAAFADADDPTIRHLFNLIVATTCISLALAPLLAAFASRLLPRPGIARDARVGDTIVVAGLGPVGNSVVETLRNEGHRLLLVDRNERLLAPWEGVAGVEIHRGRIEQIDDWLPRLGQRPPLVVLTFPIADTSALVARRLREFDPRLVVLARAPFRAQIDVLRSAGVQFVICDEEETTRSLLPLLNEALRAAPPSSTRPTVMLRRVE